MAHLNRTLNLAEVIFFGVGSVLGAGIYTLIGKVAGQAGSLLWLAFLIASVVALLSAFAYAELAAAFPKAGGEYEYGKQASGEKAGLVIGGITSLNGIISGATVSLGFAGYLGQFLDAPQIIAALGILGLIFLVNVSGIRQSSTINIIFTLIEVGGLAFVIYSAWPKIGEADYTTMPDGGVNGLLLASALSYFAYLGFEEIVKLGEETKNPEKVIPKALFIAGIIVVVVYTLVALSATSVLPSAELGKSESPLADIVGVRFGETGVMVIAAIALFATSNTILSNMLGSSRIILSMAKDHKFLKKLSIVSDNRKTPVTALLFVVGIMCLFAMIGKIEMVALIANFFIFVTFLAVNFFVIRLRFTKKNLKRPFRIPGAIAGVPVIPVIAILLTLGLIGYTVYGLMAGVGV
ncbi:MAG TPA: amino acid permease [Patescibacteria group bacterium]|nr:amino acid permease [Patescibacteria group bacterium]